MASASASASAAPLLPNISREVAGIFWDLENLQIPKHMDARLVAAAVRALLPPSARQVAARAYADVRKVAPNVAMGLHDASVDLVHVPVKSKNGADLVMIQVGAGPSSLNVSGHLDLRADLFISGGPQTLFCGEGRQSLGVGTRDGGCLPFSPFMIFSHVFSPSFQAVNDFLADRPKTQKCLLVIMSTDINFLPVRAHIRLTAPPRKTPQLQEYLSRVSPHLPPPSAPPPLPPGAAVD